MGTASAVGIHYDLAAGKPGISGGPADDELAGGVDVEDEVAVEEGGDVGGQGADEAGEYYLPDILLDAGVHGLVGIELIVLGTQYYSMYAHGLVGLPVEFHAELRLGIGTEIGDFPAVAHICQHAQQLVRKVEGQRHIVGGILAGITEHHALVPGALGHLVLAHHAAVYIRALLVDGGDDSAGRGVEAVLRLGVTYAGDGVAHYLLDVHVCVLGRDLASDDYETCCAEGLASYLCLRILAEEFV